MRDEGDHIIKAMDETFEIGRRVGADIVVSHHKCSGRANFGRMAETLPKFSAAMKQQQISFDVYPYVAGSTILRYDMVELANRVMISWSDKMPGMGGRYIDDIAREMGCSVREAAERLQPAGGIYFIMDENDVQAAMAHPGAMIGSDGIPFDEHPHPRLWGTFPRVLGRYSRDLKLFPLEDAVRRMTSYSAQRFKLVSRGEVKAGYYADLCIFDPATVIDTATFDKPISPARGIDTVICNGAIAWRDGKPGGGRAGRVLKRGAE
jgi:N-acyl-D-amino-acid deacylase